MSLLIDTLDLIRPQDVEARQMAQDRLDSLTMPHWALGQLMDTARDLAGISGSLEPHLERRVIAVMAGDHGVCAEGVSAFPQEVTPQMVANFVTGGAGVNALARTAGADVMVVDMGVAGDLAEYKAAGAVLDKHIARGTANMMVEPAMTRKEAEAAITAGIEVANDLAESYDILCTGDMGIGNTTASAAIAAVFTGQDVDELTGYGTGITDAVRHKKVSVIKEALRIHAPSADDPVGVLEKVGGFEIGGICGFILGCAALKRPVVVDGFISTAGALLAQALSPSSVDYMICAHCSQEHGHRFMLEHLGKDPLLDLGFRLGEGTGAAMALPLIESAGRLLSEVATFEEAAVSGRE